MGNLKNFAKFFGTKQGPTNQTLPLSPDEAINGILVDLALGILLIGIGNGKERRS